MGQLRHVLAVLMIAVVAASTIMLPASAFAAVSHGGKAAMSDCHCPKSDCAKNSHCSNAVCASFCANWLAAYLPSIAWMALSGEATSAIGSERLPPTLDRPPPLPPPRV